MNLAGLIASIAALAFAASTATAQSLSAYEIVRESTLMSSTLFADLTVSCPQGTDVLSGGYRILGIPTAGMRPLANRPTDDGDGWYVGVASNSFASWGLEVTAVCGVVQSRVQISATILFTENRGEELEVECSGDARALGGGAEVASNEVDVYVTSWGVQGIFDTASTFGATSADGTWSLTVYLICGNVPGYEIAFDDLQGNQGIKDLEAVCADDRVPVGGGLSVGQLQALDTAYRESTLSDDGRGWTGSVRDFGSDDFWTAVTIAVCAPEPGATALAAAALAAIALVGRRAAFATKQSPRSRANRPRERSAAQ